MSEAAEKTSGLGFDKKYPAGGRRSRDCQGSFELTASAHTIGVNSGLSCWVADGPSSGGHLCRPIEVESGFIYATEQDIGMPDLEGFMTDDDPGLLAFRQMITDLPSREDVKDFNAMILSGWLALACICGVPAWRPHLWLDGSRGSGKSWIIENIIGPLLGDYCLHVKGNSTEAGLRDYLNYRATAVVFDEAEMENRAAKTRMEGVMTILRHITSGQRARVLQGSPGGGARRAFRPTAMFLLSSIGVNLENSADRSRFARVHLARPLDPYNFTTKIAIPAGRILTPEFSARFIGRMVRRAFALRETAEIMITGLRAGDFGMDARTADVHGTLLASAYLLYHDNDLESVAEALDWVEGLGKIVWSSLCRVNDESREGFDHGDILSTILSSPIVVESQNSKVTETGSSLIHCVMEDELADDCLVVPETADRKLQSIGIRFLPAGAEGVPGDPCFGNGALVIACRHPGMRALLEKTPWVNSYHNVPLQ